MHESTQISCIVCGAMQHEGLSDWHSICKACGYESAALAPAINQSNEHDLLDEAKRETALRSLRKSSFDVIIAHAKQHVHVNKPTLLDVGSAHGWFLEQAANDFQALGVEPDKAVFLKAEKKGLNVRNGYFPDALKQHELFDVIVFNDVIEHIPEIDRALETTRLRLNQDGILILNLPSSEGLFYRLSKVFKRVGISGPFERMWQKGLPSPHVHYFNRANLQRIAEKMGFRTVEIFELPSVTADGLWERIRCVASGNIVTACIQYLIIRGALPLVKLFKSDIVVCVFRKL